MTTFQRCHADGSDAGKGSASWIEIDDVAAARWILKGIADGDPEVMDIQPSPLSGEWAGKSIPEIIDGYNDMSDEDAEQAADAYEEGFSQAFWATLEDRAAALVEIDGPTLDREGRYRVDGWPAVAVYVHDQYADRAVVVMVGDDREHDLDASDLTAICEDDYCPGCGQIGCHAYADGSEG